MSSMGISAHWRNFYPGMQKYMDYMKDKGLPGTKVNPAIGPLVTV